MSILLISLGTSPAIVPEAFLFREVEFDAVHVLTTESTAVEFVEEWFAEWAPRVVLSITRVAGFRDFTSEAEHFLFEEVLYRWYLEKAGTERPFVCLAGGFKTMSSAMQKAAAVLGAAEVFHVLADSVYPGEGGKMRPAATAEEIVDSLDRGKVHWIRLGSEGGWPQFQRLRSGEYPLRVERVEGVVRWVRAPDGGLRSLLSDVVERSHNIAGAWDALGELPFKILATWPAARLAWLGQPVDPDGDREWMSALPKIELHCHLGGFATHRELLREVREAAHFPDRLPELEEPAPPDGWPSPASPIGLESYMRLGNANGSTLLRDPGCLQRQCELLYEHLCEQNVVYAEIRCSPNNYTSPGRSGWDVLNHIRTSFQQCMEAIVPASVPLDRTVPPAVPAAAAMPDSPRRFIPFDRDAEYRQTWRDLPHRHQPGATVFATFRLADSLPRAAIQSWIEEKETFLATHPKPWNEKTWTAYRRQFPERLEAWLDEAHGECLLREARIGTMMEGALRYFDGARYVLDAFSIMPNHVHVLFKPMEGHDLTSILHSWKSFTAKEINRMLGRQGQVWEHESFDHLVRRGEQLRKLRAYVQANPEKAGLKDGFLVGMGAGLELGSGRAGGLSRSSTLASRRLAPTDESSRRLALTDESSRRLALTDESSRRLAPTINLIVIATRKDGGDRSDISRHLALAVTAADQWISGCRVVGVDLAGFEKPETRAALFATDFEPVHRVGLAVTVHAGENDDAEGIWQAVFKLNARRLGHALHLRDAPDLLQAVADRGIGVEMCPFANVQIRGFRRRAGESLPDYPLADYLAAGVPVTVNTDNIGISAATLTDNLLLAARLCPGLTRLDILRLQAHAVATAFLVAAERSVCLQRIEKALGLMP